MITDSFEYHRAQSVDEAIQMLQENEESKLLAGGHSLLPAMKLRLSRPEKLIDIARLSELKFIREEGNKIVIGAATTHQEIVESDLIGAKVPLLKMAGETIGDVQVRNVGTLGGSLAHADPAADWPASMLATEASIELKGANGNRVVAAADFFQGLFMTALEPNELIVAIHVPIPAPGTRAAYLKFVQPASRFAIVGCAVMATRNNGSFGEVKLAFTGVGEVAFRDAAVEQAINGKTAEVNAIQAAADQAAEGVDILSDHFASESYRKHLAKVYARKTLLAVAN
ncbi:MAG: xanthine dehydrogenase family protein subunit M [Bacteroidota bacterium]